jgi:pSer/pThr/pTyr-binding forkhead associated (FHA) protein
MAKSNSIEGVSLIVIILATILLAVTYNKVTEVIGKPWSEVFYALILAILVALAVHIVYRPERKVLQRVLQKTMNKKSPAVPRLILLNNKNKEIKIIKNEETFGREYFFDAIPDIDLQYIGRQHFKIITLDDGLYIDDQNSANGTKLNGEAITGLGRKKLNDGDEILVADVLKMKYFQN